MGDSEMGMGGEKGLKKQMANILTGLRIIGSVLLMFLPTFSLGFYFVYLLCGFTDMIDGTVVEFRYSAIAVCAVATISAIHEGLSIVKREYRI